jgi:hypothetical protein
MPPSNDRGAISRYARRFRIRMQVPDFPVIRAESPAHPYDFSQFPAWHLLPLRIAGFQADSAHFSKTLNKRQPTAVIKTIDI